MHKMFLPYNVLVGSTRPARAPYTMVVIGGTPDLFELQRDVAGVALLDCNDNLPSAVVFAFPPILEGSLHGLIVTIAQEAAHAYGLQHTADREDLMHPTVNPAQRAFVDRTSAVAPPRLCPPLVQNSHAALLSVLGPWPGGPKPLLDGQVPDIEPPQGTILAPAARAASTIRSAVRTAAKPVRASTAGC